VVNQDLEKVSGKCYLEASFFFKMFMYYYRSFTQNSVGGVFHATSLMTGSMADLLQSITSSTDLSSDFLKPKPIYESEPPSNIVKGVVQGTEYFSMAVIHGTIGIIGNPYRGLKKRRPASFAKGVISGLGGFFVSPLIGSLGFVAKLTEGVNETSQVLRVNVIKSRCRPNRVVGWGDSIGNTCIPYLKAYGIRIHSVRFAILTEKPKEDEILSSQKRKAFASKERERHKSYYVGLRCDEHRSYTRVSAPYLVPISNLSETSDSVFPYAVTFEETVIIRTDDLQLSDEIQINLYGVKSKYSKSSSRHQSIAQCKLSMGDIYAAMVPFYAEIKQLKKNALTQHSETIGQESSQLVNNSLRMEIRDMRCNTENLVTLEESTFEEESFVSAPAIQEFVLMKNVTKDTQNLNPLDLITEELALIQHSSDDESDCDTSIDSFFQDMKNNELELFDKTKRKEKKKKCLDKFS